MASAASVAAQPIDLQFNLPAGTIYSVKSSETMQMQAQVKDQWGQQQPMNQTFESPTNYRVEVLQGTAGVGGDPAPAHVRFTFEPGQFATMGDGQSGPQRQPLPYAGKAFDAVRQNGQVNIMPQGSQGGGRQGGNGQFGGGEFGGGQSGNGSFGGRQVGNGQFGGGEFGGGQSGNGSFGGNQVGNGEFGGGQGGNAGSGGANGGMDPETRETLQNLATFNESTLLPGRPVSVGDSWNPDTTSIMKAASMEPGGSLQMTARMAGIGETAGRPAALLDLHLMWNGTVQGLVMKGPQQGRASIDLATGLLLSFEIRGQLQISASPQMGVNMNGTANLVSTRTVSNLQTPAAARATHEEMINDIRGGGGGGQVVTINEEDLGGGEVVNINEEDLGGGAEMNVTTPPFAGTFVGEKLSVTLVEGERRTIEIRRGETVTKGYLTGNREISQSVGVDGVETVITFQGFFEFNGTKFGFNAEQPMPGVMLFTTGKTTHELKAETTELAAPNPFE